MRRQNLPTLQHTIDKDGRHKRRSIADGIEVLRHDGKLRNDQNAEIVAVPLPLPNGEVPSMVFVICHSDPDGPANGVPLPTSAHFSASNIGHEQIETYEISLLDGARVHADGTVTLLSGKRLQAVNLIPKALPWELTERQKRIVYWPPKNCRFGSETVVLPTHAIRDQSVQRRSIGVPKESLITAHDAVCVQGPENAR